MKKRASEISAKCYIVTPNTTHKLTAAACQPVVAQRSLVVPMTIVRTTKKMGAIS